MSRALRGGKASSGGKAMLARAGWCWDAELRELVTVAYAAGKDIDATAARVNAILAARGVDPVRPCNGKMAEQQAVYNGARRPGHENRFEWTEARRALARRLYVDELMLPEAIAEQLGGGCTAKVVRSHASRQHWPALLPPGLINSRRQAVAARARAVRSAACAAPGILPRTSRAPHPRPAGRSVVEQDERALIDAAVAAGKVTVLPSARAYGLSALEKQFWTPGPAPPAVDDRRAASVARGAHRGLAASSVARASRSGGGA